MRHTRAHTRNRRSHHALKVQGLSTCEKCKSKHVRHTMCAVCGTYRGRVVVDTLGALKKKEAKKKKAAAVSAKA